MHRNYVILKIIINKINNSNKEERTSNNFGNLKSATYPNSETMRTVIILIEGSYIASKPISEKAANDTAKQIEIDVKKIF